MNVARIAASNVINALTGEYTGARWAMRPDVAVNLVDGVYTLYFVEQWPVVWPDGSYQCVPTLVSTDADAIVNKLTEIYEVQS